MAATLHEACAQNNVDAARQCLDRGVAVDELDAQSRTALGIASSATSTRRDCASTAAPPSNWCRGE